MPKQTQKQRESTKAVVDKYKTSANDTGSPEVQAAIFTTRINELTGHLRTHAKDYSSQRGLLKLVGQRRRILDYLQATDANRYRKLVRDLDLRK